MTRATAVVAVTAFCFLSACEVGTGPAAPGPEPGQEFACPTPSDARITSEFALTGQDLLRSSEYFTLMINHGSLENLQRVLGSARAEHNAGVAAPEDIARLERAIAFRQAADCPDVPSFSPYDFGDVAFDGVVPAN